MRVIAPCHPIGQYLGTLVPLGRKKQNILTCLTSCWGESLPVASKSFNSRPEFVRSEPALTGIVRSWNKPRCYLQWLTLRRITSMQWQKHTIFYKRFLEYLSHSCSSSFQYIFSYLSPSSSTSSLRALLSARASPRINSISPGSPLSISPNSFPNSFLFFIPPPHLFPLLLIKSHFNLLRLCE